jgi:hypothetical protein
MKPGHAPSIIRVALNTFVGLAKQKSPSASLRFN